MKLQVKRFFDNSFKTYDNNANIQKIIANHLAGHISKNYYEQVLELGVGSGLFTKLLMDKISFKKYVGIDLSYNLLTKAKSKFDELSFINADIDYLPVDIARFDIITGSSVLQWLEFPKNTISLLIQNAKKGTEFYFSIFLEGTFSEMKHLYHLTGFGSVFNLKDENFYKDIFYNFNKSEWIFEKQNYVLYYDSVQEFLKQHKKTGARYTEKKSFTSKQSYINFCRLYEELFKNENNKIPVTYSILYIRGVK
ncbi:methyltransferase domain-containing protein [Deferribacter autotrophicus]|uniref:Methyltransferase domain-containing protein n=1 Tax=Deferribacter autotrophicus TaxID=500465 RepID=A0A5A8F5R6_9BACT|nr:class I SAM-dependent methyltransferase [Deferribacter autotrophicus]KAA0259464.1 methyltransferase domain-containing protein [Deferribacter autotrophicus]